MDNINSFLMVICNLNVENIYPKFLFFKTLLNLSFTIKVLMSFLMSLRQIHLIFLFFSLDKYTAIGVADGGGHVTGRDRLCTFTIRSNRYKGRNRTGELFSPTYPGTSYIINSSDLGDQEFIYPFSSRHLSQEYKMRLQVHRRARAEN